MQIETQEIQNGGYLGKKVWICHYNRPDLNKKPLRNVPPTEVMVFPNDELPINKNIYYSKTHFRPINKIGLALKKYISPVDNTGYRTMQGNPLFVFDSKKECYDMWNSQIKKCIKEVDNEIKNASKNWIKEKDQLILKILSKRTL